MKNSDSSKKLKKSSKRDDDEEEEEDEGEEGEEEEIEEENKLDKGNFFGYVDENGNVVYVDLEEEDNVIIFNASNDITNSDNDNNSDNNNNLRIGEDDGKISNQDVNSMIVDNNGFDLESVSISLTDMDIRNKSLKSIAQNEIIEKMQNSSKTEVIENITKLDKKSYKKQIAPIIPETVVTNLSKYFLERTDPSPRINPCLMVLMKTEIWN